MLIATEEQLREHVVLNDEALAVIEDGFARLARGEADIPPIMGLEIPDQNGAADVKAAYVAGWDSFAIKISTRFFDNPGRGLPSGSGLMTLFDGTTGRPRAVLLDNGYLTTVRTALAGAVAARYLARRAIDTVTVIGAGSQARWQLQALSLVREFNRVLVCGIDHDESRTCAEHVAQELGMDAEAADTVEQAVRAADVVLTTTPAREAVVRADWLRPGAHVTAMGSDAPHKNELDPAIFERADLPVCDLLSQSRSRGELRTVLEAGMEPSELGIHELGDIVNGSVAGRESEQQISVCDLTGVGVQDTAIARYAVAALEDAGFNGESA